jgi:uncharacterized membrane protein
MKIPPVGTLISPPNRKGSTTKVHVNQHNIRSNTSNGTELPVITIKSGKENFYADRVEIQGPSTINYCGANGKPLLSCGARVIIETTATVKIIK